MATDSKKPALTGESRRREWSSELFRAYDADGSGLISSTEFLDILRVLDPTLESEDVERTFNAVGASGSLDEEHLWLWCANVFGDFTDDEFADQLQVPGRAGLQQWRQELVDAKRRPDRFERKEGEPAQVRPGEEQPEEKEGDVRWLIDAAQHELALLETASLAQSRDCLEHQLAASHSAIVTNRERETANRPAELRDQAMVRKARRVELELAQMAAGDREIVQAQAG